MIIGAFWRTRKLPWAEMSRLNRLEVGLFCREPKRKSLSTLVGIDQVPKFHAWKLRHENGHVGRGVFSASPNFSHCHCPHSDFLPEFSLSVREYERREKRREFMLDEQLLCARRALQSVLKALHLLREVFFTLPPHTDTLYGGRNQKRDLRREYMVQTSH